MDRAASALALTGIAVFATAALVAPFLSHPDYSSIRHTVSQLAGQAMPGAWMMRAGFWAFGLGTLAAAVVTLRREPAVSAALAVFGAAMAAAALWSNLPIDPALGGDAAEDRAHSIAASVMGFAFCTACLVRLGAAGWPRADRLSWLGAMASIALPALMLALPDVQGVPQRVMFAIAFAWIARQFAGRKGGQRPVTVIHRPPSG